MDANGSYSHASVASLSLSVMCMRGSGVGTRAVYKLSLLSCKGEFCPALTPGTSIMRDLSEGVCEMFRCSH